MINSSASYGQLALLNPASTGNVSVGISATYTSDFATRRYANVMTGIAAANISNERTLLSVSSGVVAALDYHDAAATTAWDARVLNFGADMAEPQHSVLDNNATISRSQIKGYDCSSFEDGSLCLTLRVQYRSLSQSFAASGNDSNAGLALIAAKRLGAKLRLGGFVELQDVSGDIAGVKTDGRSPSFGAFIGYAQNSDGSGLQARAAVSYARYGSTFERANLLGTATTVAANSHFETYGALAQLDWGIQIATGTLVTPFVGVSLTKAGRQAYSEGIKQAGVIDAPFSYAAFVVRQTAGLFGVKVNGNLSPRAFYYASFGGEHDLDYTTDSFALHDGSNNLLYTSSAKPRDTRLNGNAGLGYRLGQRLALTLDGYASQAPYGARANYMIAVGFKSGF